MRVTEIKTKRRSEMQQQGDVLLKKVNSVPLGAKALKRQPRGWVLAEGEATGHAHVITEDVELYEHNGKLYLHTDKSVELTHEEHHTQVVEPGVYEIGIVQEWDYLEKAARRVAD